MSLLVKHPLLPLLKMKKERMRKCLAIFNLWVWLHGAVPGGLRWMPSIYKKWLFLAVAQHPISSKLSAIRLSTLHHQCLMETYQCIRLVKSLGLEAVLYVLSLLHLAGWPLFATTLPVSQASPSPEASFRLTIPKKIFWVMGTIAVWWLDPSLNWDVCSHHTIRCSKQVPWFASSINAGINEHLLSKKMALSALQFFPRPLVCWAAEWSNITFSSMRHSEVSSTMVPNL
jgi:hypothetical protein